MKLSKTVNILVAIALIVNLAVQLLSILSLTKTRIGKKIRSSIIGSMYDYMEESVDQAASRMPEWEEKLG